MKINKKDVSIGVSEITAFTLGSIRKAFNARCIAYSEQPSPKIMVQAAGDFLSDYLEDKSKIAEITTLLIDWEFNEDSQIEMTHEIGECLFNVGSKILLDNTSRKLPNSTSIEVSELHKALSEVLEENKIPDEAFKGIFLMIYSYFIEADEEAIENYLNS